MCTCSWSYYRRNQYCISMGFICNVRIQPWYKLCIATLQHVWRVTWSGEVIPLFCRISNVLSHVSKVMAFSCKDNLLNATVYTHAYAHMHHYKRASLMPCILIARFISQVLFAFFCLLKGGAYHTASYKLEMVIVGSSFLNGISVPGPPPKTQTQTHTHTHC